MSDDIVDELNFYAQRVEVEDARVAHLLAEAAGTIQSLRTPLLAKREPPALPTPGSRLQAAISLWHRFGDSNIDLWEDETHKAEYLDAIDGLATGWLFSIMLSRINFDGMDPRTFSLAELQRAIVGAEWP